MRRINSTTDFIVIIMGIIIILYTDLLTRISLSIPSVVQSGGKLKRTGIPRPLIIINGPPISSLKWERTANEGHVFSRRGWQQQESMRMITDRQTFDALQILLISHFPEHFGWLLLVVLIIQIILVLQFLRRIVSIPVAENTPTQNEEYQHRQLKFGHDERLLSTLKNNSWKRRKMNNVEFNNTIEKFN